jgi:hypothetical protein
MSPIAIRPNIPAGVWAPPDHRPAPPIERSGPKPTRIVIKRPSTSAPVRSTVTHLIENTSKPLKAQYALFFTLFALSIIMVLWRGELLEITSVEPIGIILCIVSITGLAITRIRIWWHHG